MKKKTKSKLNSSISFAFFIAVLICLLGASGNFFGFYKSFTSTLSKINEEPIATISFKYKTAQRKFLERIAWDRLREESPLYNGDTIHTAELAEATITFKDGNRINLYESTMIQIWAESEKDGGKKARVLSGSLSADFETESGEGLLIETPSVSDVGIKVTAGSSVNVDVNNGGRVQVVSGNAVLASEDGTEKQVTAGESFGLEGSEVKVPELTVISPSPNQKILFHTDDKKKITFEWKTANISENTNIILEIATDKKFENILSSEKVEFEGKHPVALDSGNYFWRLKMIEGNNEASQVTVGSKLQIIQALPPALISPVQDYSYSYRTKTPAVRFIWGETNQAASYRLVIADNKNLNNPIITQRTNSTSSIISTLEEGTYYWQVTPYFTLNREGFSAHSKIHSFTISKNGALEKPVILVPMENAIVNIEDTAKDTFFSWKQENEAVRYNIEFSKSKDFTAKKIKTDTQENYVSLNGKNSFDEGQWFWRVTQTDVEGNISEASQTGSFYALKGQPNQHIIEPVDSYKVAQNLLPDLSFTWKKNLPDFYESHIEISGDENFTNIIYSAPASGYSVSGINLEKGKYWWRLVSTANNEAPELITSARCIDVISNLPEPVLEAPLNRAVARETIPFEYKWKDVDDADFYKVYVYREDTNKLVYEDIIYSNSFTLDMFNNKAFEDKAYYRWELQARANAIPGISSRRSGNISEGRFQLYKLRPVEVTAPKKKAVLDGVDAALKKIKISWTAIDNVSEAQIVIKRKSSEAGIADEVVLKVPTDEEFNNGKKIAPNTITISNPNLRDGGNYEVLVLAKTLDGIDISNTDNKNLGKFSITPVEPLPAAENLSTNPVLFDTEYLKNIENPRSITLKWSSVRNATDYKVEVKNSKNEVLLRQAVDKKETSVTINWMELIQNAKTEKEKNNLYNGTFTWTVEAIRKIDTDNDGVLDTELQPGLISNATFKTEVKLPKSANGKGAKNPYGK